MAACHRYRVALCAGRENMKQIDRPSRSCRLMRPEQEPIFVVADKTEEA